MKKTFITVHLIVLSFVCFAQSRTNALQLSGGKSFHGSGDLDGIAIEAAYEHSFAKRLDFSNGITTTIHYGKDNIANYAPGSSVNNGELHFTTAGVQLTSMMHFAPLVFSGSKFRIGAGGVARFQSSSNPSIYGYYNLPNTFPEPFFVTRYEDPQNTFSVGYTFGISYIARIKHKYQAGIKAQFQNDTNGDAITQISLIIGRFMNPSK